MLYFAIFWLCGMFFYMGHMCWLYKRSPKNTVTLKHYFILPMLAIIWPFFEYRMWVVAKSFTPVKWATWVALIGAETWAMVCFHDNKPKPLGRNPDGSVYLDVDEGDLVIAVVSGSSGVRYLKGISPPTHCISIDELEPTDRFFLIKYMSREEITWMEGCKYG